MRRAASSRLIRRCCCRSTMCRWWRSCAPPSRDGALASDFCYNRLCGQRSVDLAEGSAMMRKLSAEFIGTAWLVLGGCGSAVLAAAFPQLGIGFVGVALAFGLTVLTMAYTFGHVSGCHLNPAVTVGLCVGRRFPAAEVVGYVVAQVMGAVAGAAALY